MLGVNEDISLSAFDDVSLTTRLKTRRRRWQQSVTDKRVALLGAGGLLAVTGGQHFGYPGAGPLACIVSAFVAGTGWKWRAAAELDGIRKQDEAADDEPVERTFDRVWYCLQPVLFASVGTEVKFELLAGGGVVIAGLAILCAGLLVSTETE